MSRNIVKIICSNSRHHIQLLVVRVSTLVVVVVVRELFSLLTSAICVQIRGQGQRL